MPPSRGDARLRGAAITGPRRDIGVVFQTGIMKQPVTGQELVTNDLIDEINRFDPEKIAAEARACRRGG